MRNLQSKIRDRMFPPVESADDEGLLAVGGDLSIDTLLQAYRGGIFPWPIEGYPLLWFAPPERAILSFDDFHVSRSLRKQMKNAKCAVTIDNAFEDVLRACAAPREYESETWILPPMIAAYGRLHRAGWAHSVEVWLDHELVGGLYGVAIGGAFFGESMFHHVTDASKVALCGLVDRLRAGEFVLLDTQWITPHLQRFGAVEISRRQYMHLLGSAVSLARRFSDD